METYKARKSSKRQAVIDFATAQTKYDKTGQLLDEKDRKLAETCNLKAKQSEGLHQQAYQSIIWAINDIALNELVEE